MDDNIQTTAKNLCNLAPKSHRTLIAIAGPPGSGKSTFAESLAPAINKITQSNRATILPMDGFHLDNCILDEQHTLHRKGAPHTFDVEGFINIVKRAAASNAEIAVPVFDRKLDLARAGARRILSSHSTILIEGNYLLLNQPPWSDLHELFDYRIYLDVPESVLSDRLTERWITHNHTPQQALERAESNDLPNARLVASCRLPADKVLATC